MQDIVISQSCTVSSKQVAEVFGKNHFHVLRDIKNLQRHLPVEFVASNFGFNKIKELYSEKETIDSVDMTRDGFSLVAMGFTGVKAIAFKLKFIAAFNKMEQDLRQQFFEAPYKPKLLDKPKTARITKSITKTIGMFGDEIIKRVMTRVDIDLLTPVERLQAKRLNLILQMEGVAKKVKKLEAEIDYLQQPASLRLIKS
jgi:Rha family phage regulatory protein